MVAPSFRQDRPALVSAVLTLVATVGFGLNFSAWALAGSVAPQLRLRLDAGTWLLVPLVVAPLAVAALGRIPVGILTDRLGPRIMFPAVSLASAGAVLAGTFAGRLPLAVLAACALGVGGTAFAVGTVLVTRAWPDRRRGAALGMFGTGMSGALVAALSPDWMLDERLRRGIGLGLAGALIAYAVLIGVLLRDRAGAGTGTWSRPAVAQLLRLPAVWRLAGPYGLAFGTLLAAALYLPAYLATTYGVADRTATTYTLLFVGAAAAARPLGGWLADRHDPARTLVACFAATTVLCVVQAFRPPLTPAGLCGLLGIAAALGVASGVLLALIGATAPVELLGTMAGLVGAVGVLGAAVPPLVMAATSRADNSAAIGVMTIAIGTGAAAGYLHTRHPWILSALPPPRTATPPETTATMVALATMDTRSDPMGVVSTLATTARHRELMIVYGHPRTTPDTLSPYELLGLLRVSLPHHSIVAVLVEGPPRVGFDQGLLAELVRNGVLVVAVVPNSDPAGAAVMLAESLRTGDLVRLVPDHTHGARFIPM